MRANGHPYPSELAGVGGSRTAMRMVGRALANEAKDKALEALSRPDRLENFLNALDVGVKRCDRTCMSIYAEAMEIAGGKQDLAAAIAAAIGGSVVLAQRSLSIVRDAESLDDATVARKSAAWLTDYCRRNRLPEPSFPPELTAVENRAHERMTVPDPMADLP